MNSITYSTSPSWWIIGPALNLSSLAPETVFCLNTWPEMGKHQPQRWQELWVLPISLGRVAAWHTGQVGRAQCWDADTAPRHERCGVTVSKGPKARSKPYPGWALTPQCPQAPPWAPSQFYITIVPHEHKNREQLESWPEVLVCRWILRV